MSTTKRKAGSLQNKNETDIYISPKHQIEDIRVPVKKKVMTTGIEEENDNTDKKSVKFLTGQMSAPPRLKNEVLKENKMGLPEGFFDPVNLSNGIDAYSNNSLSRSHSEKSYQSDLDKEYAAFQALLHNELMSVGDSVEIKSSREKEKPTHSESPLFVHPHEKQATEEPKLERLHKKDGEIENENLIENDEIDEEVEKNLKSDSEMENGNDENIDDLDPEIASSLMDRLNHLKKMRMGLISVQDMIESDNLSDSESE